MTIEQIRARLAEIAAKLESIVASEQGYSEDQITEIETFNSEFESLTTQLEALEKVEAIKAKASSTTGRKTQSPSPQPSASTPRVEVGRQLNDRFGGFNSTGEFLMAVKRAGQTGDLDKRFMQNATAYEKVGEDGGFLVPEEISQAILKKLEVQESLMSATTALQVGGNALTINVDESQPWNQGIQAYWTAEGAAITESKSAFKQASWRLQKLAALVKATDELLDDAMALESYIKASAPEAFMNKINSAILSGNGAGKPQGIISSPFSVTVAAEGGQSADTVVAANVIKMYSRMFPGSRARSAWYINPAVEQQLRLMVDGNDNYIFIGPGGFGSQMNQSPYGTLLGRPVIPLMGSMPALGDVGDIILADLSYYYMIRKAGGIKSATSIHLLFDKEQTAFRFSMRLDGKCPFTAPVTTEFGSYDMSAFVLLAAR
jgi:HK97 family phage major capsid protein